MVIERDFPIKLKPNFHFIVDGNYSSNMENNSTYGFETKFTTVITEAYSMSERPPTTTSYPSTNIALIKDKNCTEEEPEVLPVPPVPGNSDCRFITKNVQVYFTSINKTVQITLTVWWKGNLHQGKQV